MFVFIEGTHAATIELQETWREGLDRALQELVQLGLETVVLTGDPATPDGRLAGVTVRAGMTPQ